MGKWKHVEQTAQVTDGGIVIQSGGDVRANVYGDNTVRRVVIDEAIDANELHIGAGGVWINGKKVG